MTRPSSEELRRGEAATWGARPTRLTLINFRPFNKNTLRGFCEVELPNGLRIRDVSVHVRHCKAWAGLPAKPLMGEDGRHHVVNGKRRYSVLLEWRDRDISDEFSRRIVELVLQQHPGALDGDAP